MRVALLLVSFTFFASATVQVGAASLRSQEGKDAGYDEMSPSFDLDEHSRDLLILDSNVIGCMEVSGGSVKTGTAVVLGDCNDYDRGFAERSIDNENWTVLFPSRKDPSQCLQATHGHGNLKRGVRMRLYPCDETNPLQHFEWYGGTIRLVNTIWCPDYRGARPNVKKDPIILKQCNQIHGAWSQD